MDIYFYLASSPRVLFIARKRLLASKAKDYNNLSAFLDTII